ncbi:MAG: hypothetical protein Q7W13_09575 [Bacteroidia bacterium]|nr:hypothetical protein [Bacteroidia bacterium]
MTEAFATWHIPLKMEELGHGTNYLAPKFRHFSLYAGETREVDAYDEYYFLITADLEISVKSEFGIYDLSDGTINEQKHEHQGKIIIINKTDSVKQIVFIQIIPKHI